MKIQFYQWLLNNGLTSVPARILLVTQRLNGIIILVDETQKARLKHPLMIVDENAPLEAVFSELRKRGLIMNLYYFDGSEAGLNLLSECYITEHDEFQFEDVYFLPYMIYDKNAVQV